MLHQSFKLSYKKIENEKFNYKYDIILEKYEGYCFDLIEEIKEILK